MRIVSLLPAATEMVAALEMRYALVGRTHECDHPAGLDDVPVVTADLLTPGLDPAAIDAAVRHGLDDSPSIYRLDVEALEAARPDIVITQHTCAVCAVESSEVEQAVAGFDHPVEIVSFDPHRFADLPGEAERLGRTLGDERAGLALRSHLERRIDFVATRVGGLSPPRVAVVEWPDPVFAPGHWVPDVVEAAGATSVFGDPGGPSTTATWEDLRRAEPEIVVLSFCGFDLDRSLAHAGPLVTGDALGSNDAVRVIAFDGSAWLSRPGPRLVDALESLAWVLHGLHPDLRPPAGMAAELIDGTWHDVSAVGG